MVRLRLAVTALVLVLLPLVLSARLLRRELGRSAPGVIEAQLSRYRELAESLPSDAPLGYLSDVPLGTPRVEQDIWFEDYQIARYALRPAHLRPQPVGEWVVGQFEDPDLVESVAGSHGLVLHRDFGEGVFLLRR